MATYNQPELSSITVPKGYYRRIGGRTGRQLGPLPIAISNARVMIGPDHILLVNGGMVMERYHRFYFSDIQALAIRRTATRKITTLLYLVLVGLFAIPAIFVTDEFARTLLLTFSLLSLSGGLADWFHGPTCACYLQTAVQTTRLFPINRIKHTRVLLDAIQSARAARSPTE